MRIPTLLQKISELAAQPERRTAIDVDLMMDYTRVLYADLLEWRSRLPASVSSAPPPPPSPPPTPPKEPTLAELAEAMEHQKPATSGAPPIATPKVPPVSPQATSAPAQASYEKDIRGMIGINDKYQIMSELFGNDKVAYEQALDFINQARNETVALNWLREQLWITEEHSDAAQIFFEIVGRFFRA